MAKKITILRGIGLTMFIAVFLLTTTLVRVHGADTSGTAAISDSAKEGIDAILLIDTSGSMRYSDTERTALEAANLFIDMMETRSSRIGVIAFTDKLQSIIPLTPINSLADKEAIKNDIAQFTYNGYTDIGLSLKEAVSMLMSDRQASNSPMLVLLTDGAIEINPNQNTRTVDMSYADVSGALAQLNAQAPIYTIGLNYNNDVDVDFLRDLSSQTLGRAYVADEAAGLPAVFNEIFADHIRSSLTEVAAFVTDGAQYTDVIIPISNAFVAEANIIMLSSQPLSDVRLTDPSGNPLSFDNDSYTLTHSNRYSMVKIVSPMEGDWTLSVNGLPNDHVTVNLIYNYNVDILISAVQEQNENALYDPAQPVKVTAGFVSAQAAGIPPSLYEETTADLYVFDPSGELLELIPMRREGSAYTVEYLPENPQDVRLSVLVKHADFEKSSPYTQINYARPPAVETTPEPAPDPTPAPEPAPTAELPTAEPAPTEASIPAGPDTDTASEKPASAGPYMIAGGAVLLLGLIALALFRRNTQKQVFSGYLEVRAMQEDGKYTSLEAPDLSTFAGRLSILEFFNASLDSKAEKILRTMTGMSLGDVNMVSGKSNGQPTILLENAKNCTITDDDGHVLSQKKIVWQDRQRLILSTNESKAKLEITYRANGE